MPRKTHLVVGDTKPSRPVLLAVKPHVCLTLVAGNALIWSHQRTLTGGGGRGRRPPMDEIQPVFRGCAHILYYLSQDTLNVSYSIGSGNHKNSALRATLPPQRLSPESLGWCYARKGGALQTGVWPPPSLSQGCDRRTPPGPLLRVAAGGGRIEIACFSYSRKDGCCVAKVPSHTHVPTCDDSHVQTSPRAQSVTSGTFRRPGF